MGNLERICARNGEFVQLFRYCKALRKKRVGVRDFSTLAIIQLTEVLAGSYHQKSGVGRSQHRRTGV